MTTPPPMPPMPPTIPLTPEVRAAYTELYDAYQTAIEATKELDVRKALLDAQEDVDNVLAKDRMYQFSANTARLKSLLLQINCTNADLVKLKIQIAAVAAHIATAADIITAINKVLTLVPGV